MPAARLNVALVMVRFGSFKTGHSRRAEGRFALSPVVILQSPYLRMPRRIFYSRSSRPVARQRKWHLADSFYVIVGFSMVSDAPR